MDGWDSKPDGWEKIDRLSLRRKDNEKIILSHSYDAMFVLAGGIDSDGLVYPWVERRLDLARKIYNGRKSKIICLVGGTYHRPPILNNKGYAIHESTSCSEYLIQTGVNPKDIYREWSSYDTIANGYFSFVNFILPMDLKKIVVITSEFHMMRTKLIFDWLNEIFKRDIKINYYSVSDEDLDSDIIDIRIQREIKSVLSLSKNLIPKIRDVKGFHKFIYEDHKAYCSEIELERKDTTTVQERESY